MWKDLLLQVLIVFLPIFMFMGWYSKSEHTRYVPVFIGLTCGMAMILSMHFSSVNEQQVYMNLRHIPFIIGSLYGGIPVAASLLVVYVARRICVISNYWEYFVLASFILVYIPILYSRISSFQLGTRKVKFKIATLVSIPLIFYFNGSYLLSSSDLKLADVSVYLGYTIAIGILFFTIMLTCVHFIELSHERIQLQEDLRRFSSEYQRQTHRLQHFIDNAPLLVVFCDTKGRITHVNDMALQLVAPVSHSDLIDQNFSVFLNMLDDKLEPDPVERALRGEGKVTEILHLNHRLFYTVCCPIPEMDSRETEGMLFIGHDVTELQQLKDELNRMDRLSLVGQMAASITHEIRNPMAVIRGFIQLLNERSEEEQKSYFRIILDELDRANSIINDFLSLAQNRVVEKESSNLNELLNDLLPLIWADANMRGQMIDLRLGESMDLLQVNSKEIKQLILNLARNGMEAMDEKGTLRIETLNFKDIVQLRVIDTGVGISQEKLDRLFEPFYTTKTNGTGLGLALCLSIVERHHGKIHVESAVGKGTTFIVSFCKPGCNCWGNS